MPNQPQRRLRHRIPVRLRHHWKLVALTGAVVALLTGVFGGGMIRPYVGSTESAAEVTITENIAGAKDIFDRATPHSVEFVFNDANYQTMLHEYFENGDKEYVSADVVIDGTTVKDVGIRLKGNSTLAGLTWNGERRTNGGPGGGQMRPPEGVELPEGAQPPEGFEPPGGNAGGNPGAGDGQQRQGQLGPGIGGALKAEEPETLPWLVKFDEFVEGRRYQDHSQIAVRPAVGSSTQFGEALAISLVDQAGEPSQRFAYSSFTVNGRSSGPRLLVEYLDEGYAENLGNGVLYKALADGVEKFSDQGGDQTEYGDDFKQINQIGSQGLQPVIDLIRWVEQSSDEEFAAGLAERLDVESFARYLALQNLVLNFDDMAGPGANYYLWYDLDAARFTVISWDMNLAFSGDATAGPNDDTGMGFGGMGLGGQQQPQAGGQANGDAGAPQAIQPPEGMQPPAAGQRGGMGPGGHALKERFLETDAFKQVYEEQYRQLYAELFASGKAQELLRGLAESYLRNDNADRAQVASELETLQATLRTRADALGSDPAVVAE